MNSIKWKCKNWIVYFRKLDNFHHFHLIVETLDVFYSHPIFFYCYYWFRTHVQDLNTFFLKIYQKWKYYKEEKQDFERFLNFLILKCAVCSYVERKAGPLGCHVPFVLRQNLIPSLFFLVNDDLNHTVLNLFLFGFLFLSSGFSIFRSSRSQMLLKIDILKNFVNFIGKHLCWSLFLIKLQAWDLPPY